MKLVIYSAVFLFGALGAYLPVWLFGAGMFDVISLLGGAIGSIAGVFIGYKVGQFLDL